MSYLELIFRNVLTRKVRSALTSVAVAIAIMAVFALGVLTFSLRETAISILRTGRADFTVGQKGGAVPSSSWQIRPDGSKGHLAQPGSSLSITFLLIR